MASAEDLKRGDFLTIGREIYKIIRKELVNVGTHSHTKIKLFCEPLGGGGEKPFIYSHQDKVDLLEVEHRVGQVISKADGKITVMDNKSYETLDVDAAADVFDKATEGGIIFFISYNGNNRALHTDKD